MYLKPLKQSTSFASCFEQLLGAALLQGHPEGPADEEDWIIAVVELLVVVVLAAVYKTKVRTFIY